MSYLFLTFLFLTFFNYSLIIDSTSIRLIYEAGFLHSCLEIIAFFLYFFGESKKIYSEINDIMWNNMLNSRDMNKYNDTDFNKQYEFIIYHS